MRANNSLAYSFIIISLCVISPRHYWTGESHDNCRTFPPAGCTEKIYAARRRDGGRGRRRVHTHAWASTAARRGVHADVAVSPPHKKWDSTVGRTSGEKNELSGLLAGCCEQAEQTAAAASFVSCWLLAGIRARGPFVRPFVSSGGVRAGHTRASRSLSHGQAGASTAWRARSRKQVVGAEEASVESERAQLSARVDQLVFLRRRPGHQAGRRRAGPQCTRAVRTRARPQPALVTQISAVLAWGRPQQQQATSQRPPTAASRISRGKCSRWLRNAGGNGHGRCRRLLGGRVACRRPDLEFAS